MAVARNGGYGPRSFREPGGRAVALAGLGVAALVLTACGGAAPADDGAPRTVAAVIQELGGLGPADREARLLDLAREEEPLDWYTSITDSDPYVDAFTDRYGLDVEVYRGTVNEVRQRILAESQANAGVFDVVNINDTGMYDLDGQGRFAAYDPTSPGLAHFPPERLQGDWVWGQQVVQVVGWNTDVVTNPPDSWEDLLRNYPGQTAWEPRNYAWFASLVDGYFVRELGWTKEQAVDLFRQAATGARAVQGNPTLFQFVSSGEVPITVASYNSYFAAGGGRAPVSWLPAVQPIPVSGHGVAISAETRSPASALLWMDWFATGGQEVDLQVGSWPSNPDYLTAEQRAYRVLPIREEYIRDADGEWQRLYADVIAQVGRAS